MAKIFESVPFSTSGTLLEVINNDIVKFKIDGLGGITPSSGVIKDTNGLNRIVINPTAKTIVDGSATALFTVPVAQGDAVGGAIDFQVYATDGTDQQMITGIAHYSSVNKAGTLTSTITYATANEAKAVSSGTLTLAFTMAETVADTVYIRVQPTGSLTETTYTITYTVRPLRGTVTIV